MANHLARSTFLKSAGVFTLALPAAAAAAPIHGPAPNLRRVRPDGVPPIYDKLLRIADLSTLASLVASVGLSQTLNGPGPYTLFAPTNEAFATMPAIQLKRLMNNLPKLTMLLTFHVLPGKTLIQQFATGSYPTLEGDSVDVVVQQNPSLVTVDKARIIVSNVYATNGTIHIVDKVLTKVIHAPN
jgi:uncharacterized surface protein with fasciclin (FAS1) repeats